MVTVRNIAALLLLFFGIPQAFLLYHDWTYMEGWPLKCYRLHNDSQILAFKWVGFRFPPADSP